MKRVILVAGLLALGVTAALAESSVVEQRQALMKQMGGETKTTGGMLRGQEPFDLAKAQAALKTISTNAKKASSLFPESSKATTEKTEALPAIWDSKATFDSSFSKLEQDAQAAMSSIKDEASFKAEFPKVLQNCGTCHKTFRKG
ncbi:c-type cytochrome [Microvirga terricola]|uniref:Cytochrome c n=1 Tax=Microvirga terricola TaxID=2719797 RepID=A0ABX0VBR7_9HYPH|nr:cytochrome c [Microvirga terricola]NIX76506.1 cytochrome c [Microvirga terricola]